VAKPARLRNSGAWPEFVFICLLALDYSRGDQLNASAMPENRPIKVTRTMKATSPITKATMSAPTEISALAIKVTRTAVHGLPAGNPAPSVVSCFLSASSAIRMTNGTQITAPIPSPMNIGMKVLAIPSPFDGYLA
jgi:hypothetical protein